jgi:uncharacterized protein
MKSRIFVPRKLDMGPFIESGEALTGRTPVSEFQRLSSGLSRDVAADALPPVDWSVRGRLLAQRVGEAQLWLDLTIRASLAWECQRCLQSVTLPIEVSRSVRFVKDEAAAAELDADCDDDVLALSRQFDLLALIEDELIMAQPIVPRHDVCPGDVSSRMNSDELTDVPGRASSAEAGPEAEADNPFAVLAALKKKGAD